MVILQTMTRGGQRRNQMQMRQRQRDRARRAALVM
jgi:hypothetical protein